MRPILLSAGVLVAFASIGHAQEFRVLSGSATYWTATDSVEFRLTFNDDLDLSQDYLGFGANFGSKSFLVDNNYNEPSTQLLAVYRDSSTNPDTLVDLGPLDYSIDGNRFTAIVPFGLMGIDSHVFEFYGIGVRNRMATEQPELHGLSSVDALVTYSIPEPSSLALASLALLCGIPLWRRYQRTRFHVQ